MKKIAAIVLVAAFVVSFGAGYLMSLPTAEAACTCTLDCSQACGGAGGVCTCSALCGPRIPKQPCNCCCACD